MTWQEYWQKNRWNLTVGKAPTKEGAYRPVKGHWNPATPFQMGQPGTLSGVLDLPENAVANDTHGFGFLDGSVMDEWADVFAPGLGPATENDRDLGRFLSQDGVTSFAQMVAKWAEGRKGDGKPVVDVAATEFRDVTGPKILARLEDIGPKIDRLLVLLEGKLSPTELHADAEAAITRPRS